MALLVKLFVAVDTPEYDNDQLREYLERELGQSVELCGVVRGERSTCPLMLIADRA